MLTKQKYMFNFNIEEIILAFLFELATKNALRIIPI